MSCFIDCHCHAFNFVDVPVFLTLADRVEMGTLKRLKNVAGAVACLPIIAGSSRPIEKKLSEYKEFIQFFERGVDRNLEAILLEIRACLDGSQGTPKNTEVLITPLVMDFDVLLEEEKSDQIGKEPSVKEQYRRLQDAIGTATVKSIPNSRVCPFVGFDLRKLVPASNDTLRGFKEFWEKSNTLGAGGIGDLEPGKLLGIKLYPPIGFNPCPRVLPPSYQAFYQWCCDNDIPLTTHCQTGSYSAGKQKKKLDSNTTPENWRRLLKHPNFKSLRINFAHFGGETGTDDMFEPFRIDEGSWTSILIGLLKEYPNTFSDLAAYDYSKEEHRRNLRRIFEMDAAGEFGPGHQLVDKVLWGSDVPMVISDRSYRANHQANGRSEYKHYFGGFVDTIRSSQTLTTDQQDTIIRNLTEANPKRFLRIQ